jgi:hypothetical protein
MSQSNATLTLFKDSNLNQLAKRRHWWPLRKTENGLLLDGNKLILFSVKMVRS